MKEYYITRTNKSGKVLYKQYKCVDGWTTTPTLCWQFSKVGATKIVERLTANDKCGLYKYGKVEA